MKVAEIAKGGLLTVGRSQPCVSRLRETLRIDEAGNRPKAVLKLHGDQSGRLELDDRAIHTADNKLTHEAPKKRKVADDHQPVICGGQ